MIVFVRFFFAVVFLRLIFESFFIVELGLGTRMTCRLLPPIYQHDICCLCHFAIFPFGHCQKIVRFFFFFSLSPFLPRLFFLPFFVIFRHPFFPFRHLQQRGRQRPLRPPPPPHQHHRLLLQVLPTDSHTCARCRQQGGERGEAQRGRQQRLLEFHSSGLIIIIRQ